MKCMTCRNLVKRRDEDGTLYDWCGKVIDSPDKDRERYCPYYHLATNADRIRSMTDEELAELIGDNIDCVICKEEIFQTTTCPSSLTADEKYCYGYWLDWLRQEAE